MSDSPRRNTQANRQARRQSPYTRPTQPPTQPEPTPSRLRSLLSYVSPFRSARKHKAPTPEPDGEAAVKEELDSSDEGAGFALHGRLLPRGREFADHAPPSPTPGTSSGSKASANSLASSASLPNLAATLATPRFGRAVDRSPSYARFADPQSALSAESAVHSTSSHATQELARFFRAKADRGEEQLTPVEQAGVLHLMQQAHGDSSVPTAFTPNFRSNPPPDALAQPGSQAGSSSGSVFGGELPSRQATGPVVSKRRRPMYVGAGYSSRRRRATIAGVSQSQSEAALSSGSDALEGKRRKTGRDAEDDIPVATLDDVVVSPAPVRTLTSQRAPAIPAIAAKEPVKSASATLAGTSASSSTSTPAKPSPLWQVSQADIPSPSPPRKSAPARPPTRAADLMLDIIRKEDAAHPPPSTSPKGAILNPYASDDNPLALAGTGRPTRTKAKSSTPRPAQRVSKVTAEVEKLKQKAQEESPLEQLERTMPAEYRRESKRSKGPEQPKPSVSEAAAPAAAPKKAGTKAPAVVELSSDAEDAEMGGAAEEDEEEEEDEEDQLVDDQAEDLPAPAFAFGTSKKGDAGASSKPTTPFSFAASAPAPPSSAPSSAKPAFSFGSSTSDFSFGAPTTSGFASASAGAAKPATTGAFTFGGASTGVTATAAAPAAAPAFSFGVPASEPPKTTSPAAANVPLAPPVLPPPATTPMAALADVASKAHAATSTQQNAGGDADMDVEGASEGQEDPQAVARALSKAQLPLAQFSFAGLAPASGAGARSRGGEVDKALEAVKDLVTGMSRSELPSFAF